MNLKNKIKLLLLSLTLSVCLPIISVKAAEKITEDNIPNYKDEAYTIVNDNEPAFSSKDKKRTDSFAKYSKLDKLGRCGVAYANICQDIMPTKQSESISSIYPSGWKKGMKWERCHLIGFQLAGGNTNEKNLITGTHYFNATGMLPFENMVADYVEETDNHVLYRVTPIYKGGNLIASGVKIEAYSVEDKGEGICFNVFVHNVKPGYRIDYRSGTVVKGTKKKSQSIKGGIYTKTISQSKVKGKGYGFNIGCKAPERIRYKKLSGSSQLSVTTKGKVTVKKNTPAGTYKMRIQISASASDIYKSKTIKKTIKVVVKPIKKPTTPSIPDVEPEPEPEPTPPPATSGGNYVINTNTGKFHLPNCRSVSIMNESNKSYSNQSRDELVAAGYSPCGNCHP